MKYAKDEDLVRILFLLFLIFICYCFILQPLGFFKVASLRTNDFFYSISRLRKPAPKEIKDIVVVAIDNDSISAPGYNWPWKRTVFADLVNKLASCKPRAIFIDFTFARPTETSEDLAFSEAIKNAACVVLAGYIDEDGNYIKSLDIFNSHAALTGIINKSFSARDLLVRNMRAVVFAKGSYSIVDYSAEVKTLALTRGIPQEQIRYEPGKVWLGSREYIPVDVFGSLPINYLASPDDFTTVSAYEILKDSPPVNPELFKDKIVMIGMTVKITHDIHPTPLGFMPGVYINANSLLMLLAREFIYSLPSFSALNLSLVLLVMLLTGFMALRLRPVYSTAILILAFTLFFSGYIFLQAQYNFRKDIFSLFFLAGISFIVVQVYRYASLIAESEKLKNLSITDPACQIYTQRYFQAYVENVLQKARAGKDNYFCLLECKDISRVCATYEQMTAVIKVFSDAVKKYAGKKALIARYGEDALTFALWNTKKKKAEALLSLIANEIETEQMPVDKNGRKPKIKIAALNFIQEHINRYEDLILTTEFLLARGSGDVRLILFNPKSDKIVSVQGPHAALSGIPKGELSYVSMDLNARNKELERALEDIKREQERIKELYFNAMRSLVRALEEKDPYTAGHSERVDIYATLLAKGITLPAEEIETIHRAAYVHDVGKIGLPDRILHKKERLDDNEFDIVKRHQADGAKILEGLPFFEEIVPMVLHHHERYDGKGYPHGLRGDMIPRGAQIIAIADSYDAMTTGRGYNSPLTIDEAIVELKRSSGSQFNPAYANKFIELLMQGKIKAL